MPNLIEYITGAASDEQGLVLALEDFMTNVLTGWSVIDKNTDTASDRDYIFYSQGTEVGKYRDLYIRWRGYNNDLDVYGYQRWVSSGDYDAQLFSTSYSRINLSAGSFTYWIFGDNDGVWILIKDGTNYFSAYGGYLETYYCDDVDDLPTCVVGQTAVSTFFDSGRVLGYGTDAAASGTNTIYDANKTAYNEFLTYGEPNQRDGSVAHIPIVLYHDSTSVEREVRGELRHCLWFGGTSLSSEDWVTLSGTTYKYFIQKYSADETMGIGPVPTTSGEW